MGHASVAYDMYTDGTSKYVVGSYYDGSNTIAVLWPTSSSNVPLGAAHHTSIATAVYLNGDNLLIVGTNDSVPVLWSYNINTTALTEPTPMSLIGVSGYASYVLAYGSNVYVLGQDATTPVYWIDSTEHNAASSGSDIGTIYGMVTIGSSVYFVGGAGPNIDSLMPVYWKSGVKTILDTGGALVYGIGYGAYSIDGSLYVAGYRTDTTNNMWDSYEQAAYWKDGAIVPLTIRTGSVFDDESRAYSIFVK